MKTVVLSDGTRVKNHCAQPGKVLVFKIKLPNGKIERRYIFGITPSVSSDDIEKFMDGLNSLTVTDCEIISWELLEAR